MNRAVDGFALVGDFLEPAVLPVEISRFSPAAVPSTSNLLKPLRAVFPAVHTPYDYD